MIEAVALSKTYANIKAVDGVSFRIFPGEVVGLLGPNGAGKTTTLRILTGSLTATSGAVSINGIDLGRKPKEAKRQLGYLPETPPLYPELTVTESLGFVAGLHDLSNSHERIDRVLEQTSLTHVRKRLVGHLSKGYRQRVGLAQAIVHDPDFVILDEPTIGLDPGQILEIRELIHTLSRSKDSKKMGVLFSSHILPEISQTCDRVIIIHRGKIIADSPMQDLLARAHKKKFLVTLAPGSAEESLRQTIGDLPGVEDVSDHRADLEEMYLKLTGEV